MCLLARTSSIKSAFLFLCFPGFREEPFFCLTNPYLLAMVVNDGAGSLTPRGVLRFIVGAPPGAGSLLQDSRPVLAAMLV
jgi:hypothetical protein